MTILFPLGAFYHSQIGGPCNTLYWHCCALKHNSVEPTVITTTKGIEKNKVLFDEWIKSDCGDVYYSTKGVFSLSTISKISKEIANADILHLNSLFSTFSIYSFIYKSLFYPKKKIVWSVRGELNGNALKYSSWKKKPLLFLYKLFNKNIVYHSTSKQETEGIKKIFPKSKVIKLPNLLAPSKRLDLQASNDLLYVGRIHPIKSLHKLISALALSDVFMKSSSKLFIAGKQEDRHDYYMVGSDQVWHPKFLLPSNGFYLLKFAPKNSRKISYASSFGSSSIPSEMKNVYRSELSAFERLSVREKHGANFLSSIGLESSIVLDPSLLLDKEDWGVFFNKNKIVPEPYIFCYVIDGDHKGAKYIQLVSEQINNFNDQQYKIIVVGDKEYKKLIRGYNLVTNAGPSEFLSLIYNAAYVVTNSFHGTCFSVNFNKQFVSVLQRENALNIRITEFLESVSLTDRLLYTDENVDQVNLLEIDYEKVNNALSSLIDKSKSFLNEALESSK